MSVAPKAPPLEWGARDDLRTVSIRSSSSRAATCRTAARGYKHGYAAALLRELGKPVLAIPGNHDIPYRFPARFTSTFTEFERLWGTAWSPSTVLDH